MKYEDVLRILKRQEFYNIRTYCIENLSANEAYREGTIEAVSFGGVSVYDATTKFPFSVDVEVVYQMVKRLNPPITSRKAKKLDIEDVVWEFSNAGFVNVTRIPIPDLLKGWLVKEDSVEMVLINGREDFKKSDRIRIDAQVVVKYHTFRNNVR